MTIRTCEDIRKVPLICKEVMKSAQNPTRVQ